MNTKYKDVMCLVCTPDMHVSNVLKSKILMVKFSWPRVGQDVNTNTVFIADRKRQGNHWTLLVLNNEENTAHYGDSLAWDIPRSLTDMVEPLLNKLWVHFQSYKLLPITIDCCHFYPVQACSNICGIIVLCMVAIMCCNWQHGKHGTTAQHSYVYLSLHYIVTN